MKVNRLNEIEHYVYLQGNASIKELAEKFDISINTVRRDIKELLKRGSIQKVYGGVTAARDPAIVPVPMRTGVNTEAKQYIARLAAEQAAGSSTVFLDTGSTVSAMIPFLLDRQKDITIVTNSLSVVEQAAQHDFNLYSLGGFYNKATAGFVGISAEENQKNMAFDCAFLTATALNIEYGLMADGYFEENVKRQVLRSCKNTYLLVDSSKFDQHALLTFGKIRDVGTIITEKKPGKEYIDYCKNNGVRLIY